MNMHSASGTYVQKWQESKDALCFKSFLTGKDVFFSHEGLTQQGYVLSGFGYEHVNFSGPNTPGLHISGKH